MNFTGLFASAMIYKVTRGRAAAFADALKVKKRVSYNDTIMAFIKH